MAEKEVIETSEAEIAVHWGEEEYYHPSTEFIAQANMADPGVLERFSLENFPNCFKEYADLLATLLYSAEYSETKHKVLNLLHLANISNITWSNNSVLDDKQQLALAIVTQAPLVIDPAGSAMQRSIVNGLNGPQSDSSTATQMLNLLEEGRQGQAILASLRLLSSGALADPEGVRVGLYVLSAAGQSAVARRIAVQILLLPAEV